MKVSVAVAVYYNYETEIPDDTAKEELLWVCDNEDPVYREIAEALHEAKLNYDAVTTSIIREDTDEILYSV